MRNDERGVVQHLAALFQIAALAVTVDRLGPCDDPRARRRDLFPVNRKRDTDLAAVHGVLIITHTQLRRRLGRLIAHDGKAARIVFLAVPQRDIVVRPVADPPALFGAWRGGVVQGLGAAAVVAECESYAHFQLRVEITVAIGVKMIEIGLALVEGRETVVAVRDLFGCHVGAPFERVEILFPQLYGRGKDLFLVN